MHFDGPQYPCPDPYPFEENLKYLAPLDGGPPELEVGSPPVTPYKDELFIPPIAEPVSGSLYPPPNPCAHQRYAEFAPVKCYLDREQEFLWYFHSDPPYDKGSWSWGINGHSPGPTYHAHYFEPILVRRFNDLLPLQRTNLSFALPSTTRHLHNAHTASESDGDPSDWIDTGDFWDHHYPNIPATKLNVETCAREFDPREKLTTLWYHDHRMDFTAANLYAGLLGFYFLFDDQDSGDENDLNPKSWRLPSGDYDIPLVLQDLSFDADGQLVFDTSMGEGVLGDRFTVNRKIQPNFRVARRKYRFRILNAGPSRFYELFLHKGEHEDADEPDELFLVITGDGNFQPEPLEAPSIMMGVAQRVDVIVDFSNYKAGDYLYLENRLHQHHGHGPDGRCLNEPEEIRMHRLMRFEVTGGEVEDPSQIPDFFRPFPEVDPATAVRERTWEFDYDGGLWTVNNRAMDPHRVDAGIDRDSAEIWTFRNNGNSWHHPIHSHLSEFITLEIDGIPVLPDRVQIRAQPRSLEDFQQVFTKTAYGGPYVCGSNVLRGPFCGGFRRDIALLGPRTEMKVFMQWPDFLGRYVLHCHNVVHEDHAMMVRWDVLPPGRGFCEPREASEVYGQKMPIMHVEARPAHVTMQHGNLPFYPPKGEMGNRASCPEPQQEGSINMPHINGAHSKGGH